MAFRYPDRWLDYSKFGARVEGTSFVPLKVPLKKDFFINRQQDSFTPTDAMEQISNLGLVVDLTFTTRYYNPMEFRRNNVEYKKLLTKGREVPKRSLVDEFIRIVDKFFSTEQNKDKVVGVHCTHGLNRTGYFVCAYMILAQGYDPHSAIRLFNEARSHEMERANYLNSLLRFIPASYAASKGDDFEHQLARDSDRRDIGGYRDRGENNARFAGNSASSYSWRRDRSPVECANPTRNDWRNGQPIRRGNGYYQQESYRFADRDRNRLQGRYDWTNQQPRGRPDQHRNKRNRWENPDKSDRGEK